LISNISEYNFISFFDENLYKNPSNPLIVNIVAIFTHAVNRSAYKALLVYFAEIKRCEEEIRSIPATMFGEAILHANSELRPMKS